MQYAVKIVSRNFGKHKKNAISKFFVVVLFAKFKYFSATAASYFLSSSIFFREKQTGQIVIWADQIGSVVGCGAIIF